MERVQCCMLSAVLSLSLPRYLLVQSELPTLPLIQSPAGARMSEFRRVSYLCAITLLQPSCLQPSVTSNTLVTSIHLLHMHRFDLVQWQWKAEKAKKTFPLISKSSSSRAQAFFPLSIKDSLCHGWQLSVLQWNHPTCLPSVPSTSPSLPPRLQCCCPDGASPLGITGTQHGVGAQPLCKHSTL